MEQSKKCKISDLTNDQLNVEKLGVILGGGSSEDQNENEEGIGCLTGICIQNFEEYAEQYCTRRICECQMKV